jgi:hypothetical protein
LRQRASSITALAAFAVTAVMLATPALSYDEGTVSGGGSIEGQVIYKGPVETRKIIPNKDVETCGGIREESLIDVGPDHGVQNAAVYLVDVAKGKAWPPPPKPPELDNIKCRFVPDVLIMRSGKLDVVNKDPVLHNTHGYYGKRTAFNMAQPNEGQVISADLTRAGIVRVDCDVHGWMLGWIYVVDNPYYALTGGDGKFSITDVPPGTYKLVAVQSLTGPNEQTVTVTAGQPTSLTIELKKQ